MSVEDPMKTNEKGVYPESEVFFLTPSETATRTVILYHSLRPLPVQFTV